ncbi:TonB-dependent receptor plug domain-containing protein [Niastella sp. OAS944]|uniref:TonB-dependent receptor plug domain-containing protein n=1 Tax=Niastella sp. OAS944 TaxID=2664089 RepID=UPI0034940246|nr:iron complex outermembrane receptor protein [Chitinophagaceae bacterium OAS944]
MIQSVSRKLFSVSIAVSCLIITARGQADTAFHNTYDGMSLKDLLNVKIVSASKSAESLFDAPLSASVIMKEDIMKSGATSIMEALRLVPGFIVREQSNGNYDIHLRGMDNVPPYASFSLTSNTTTLVMIDNHPIYSYLHGGTFWETLPIGMNDVERIEVVRGPAAALYGPNAVNGVINIITKDLDKRGWYATVNNRQGTNHTYLNNASVGYKFNKVSIIASGNYQHRDRSQSGYYEYYRDQWFEHPDYMIKMTTDTVKDLQTHYPHHNTSMEKLAGNLFVNYRLSAKDKLSLSTGMQHSISQRVSVENGFTPLSFVQSDTRYADLRGNIKDFSIQLSHNSGTQNVEFTPGNKYDFSIFHGNVEYNYIKRTLSIKPGFSYQSAVYDDGKYADTMLKNGLFNARGLITTATAYLRSEYKLFNNALRLVGGLAISKFNYPDTAYLSYQLAATFKLNKNNLVRAVFSSAPRSSTVYNTYVAQAFYTIPTGVNRWESMAIIGNKDLKLLTAKMIELGYRSEISRHVSVDAELFRIHSHNYSLQVYHNPYDIIYGADTVNMSPIMTTNLPMQLNQTGVTVSVTIDVRKLKIKPFVTWQQTIIKDFVASDLMPNVVPGATDIYSGIGNSSVLNSTPALYGGATVDYKLARKLNVNLSTYFFTKQEYHHISGILLNNSVQGTDRIAGKFILNANVSYEPVKGLMLFCAGRNLLNQTVREFYYTDKVPLMLMGGFSYKLP